MTGQAGAGALAATNRTSDPCWATRADSGQARQWAIDPRALVARRKPRKKKQATPRTGGLSGLLQFASRLSARRFALLHFKRVSHLNATISCVDGEVGARDRFGIHLAY